MKFIEVLRQSPKYIDKNILIDLMNIAGKLGFNRWTGGGKVKTAVFPMKLETREYPGTSTDTHFNGIAQDHLDFLMHLAQGLMHTDLSRYVDMEVEQAIFELKQELDRQDETFPGTV